MSDNLFTIVKSLHINQILCFESSLYSFSPWIGISIETELDPIQHSIMTFKIRYDNTTVVTTHEFLLLSPYEKSIAALLIAILFLMGVFIKVRMIDYLLSQGFKRPVNVIIFFSQIINCGKEVEGIFSPPMFLVFFPLVSSLPRHDHPHPALPPPSSPPGILLWTWLLLLLHLRTRVLPAQHCVLKLIQITYEHRLRYF